MPMKARKINGVRVKPRWDWSKVYEAEFRAMMAGPKSNRDTHEAKAIKYARWLALRDGVDLSRSNSAVAVWRYETVTQSTGREVWKATAIRSVRFEYRKPYERRRYHSGGRWRGEDDPRETIAEIQIPHFDFKPVVTESTLLAEAA